MVVLALETVTRAGSVALVVNGACTSTLGDPDRMHGERLPGELLSWLARHGTSLKDVTGFAAITGPGSFTGLRVGIAAIQGLALASGRTVVPLPTLDAMVLAWMQHRAPSPDTIVAACLDGHRDEVFSAVWRIGHEATLAGAELVLAPRVGPAERLAEEVRSLSGHGPVVVVGDGGRRYAAAFDRAVQVADVPVPLAAVAARFAVDAPDRAVAPHALRPVYIRRPDAELARERAGGTVRVVRS
jgi:tRNA threonylcarbamoyladenosine biosynthesis protein TsaB